MPRIAMKFGAWPESDRVLWRRITAQGCPLDDQAAGAHWATETKRVVARDYGYWLSFVLAQEPSAETEHPTARVTPERVRQYCQSMDNVCALTRASRIARLQNVVLGADPAHDWSWLSKMRRALEKAARREGPVRKKHGRIVSTGRIIDAGILLMQKAHADDGRRIAIRAKDFRDGLMLALLAARPLRLKNFTALRLDVHLRSTSDGYLIDIPGNETKAGSPIATFVPERLCPWLALYLNDYRPVLLKDRHSDYLWVHPNNNRYQPGALSMRVSKLTARVIGIAVSPHLFRDCAATTVATDDPEHVLIIATILSHTSLRTAENHYNQAKGLDANRCLQACVKRLRGKAPR